MVKSRTFTRQSKIGLAFMVLSLFLPIGIRYHISNDSAPSWIEVECAFPLVIEVIDEGWQILFLRSSLGIFLPLVLSGHSILSYYGYKIMKREAELLHIQIALLLLTLFEVVMYFPTFHTDWGSIPLPLTLLIGLPLAKLGTLPSAKDPFEKEK